MPARSLCAALACAAVLAMAARGAAPAKLTDRNEYDLVLTIRAEAAAQKRLVLLDQWKAKYPKTELLAGAAGIVFFGLPIARRQCAHAERGPGDGRRAAATIWWVCTGRTLLVPEVEGSVAGLAGRRGEGCKAVAGGPGQVFRRRRDNPPRPRRKPGRSAAPKWKCWATARWAGFSGSARIIRAPRAEFTKCLEIDPTAAEISAWLRHRAGAGPYSRAIRPPRCGTWRAPLPIATPARCPKGSAVR